MTISSCVTKIMEKLLRRKYGWDIQLTNPSYVTKMQKLMSRKYVWDIQLKSRICGHDLYLTNPSDIENITNTEHSPLPLLHLFYIYTYF